MSEFLIKDGFFEKNKGKRQDVIIPDNVKIIGVDAFLRNKSLQRVIIPDGVNEIGMGAFYECKNLISISLPKSLCRICNRICGMF